MAILRKLEQVVRTFKIHRNIADDIEKATDFLCGYFGAEMILQGRLIHTIKHKYE